MSIPENILLLKRICNFFYPIRHNHPALIIHKDGIIAELLDDLPALFRSEDEERRGKRVTVRSAIPDERDRFHALRGLAGARVQDMVIALPVNDLIPLIVPRRGYKLVRKLENGEGLGRVRRVWY